MADWAIHRAVQVTFILTFNMLVTCHPATASVHQIQQVKRQLNRVLESLQFLEKEFQLKETENRACELMSAHVWGVQQKVDHLENRVNEIPQMLHEFQEKLLMCLIGPMPDCLSYIYCSKHPSGLYDITPPGHSPVSVYCDMTTWSGGWTVIQQRVDNSTDFNRTYQDYRDGFGNPNGNFWIGLDNIHALTGPDGAELYVHLQTFEGEIAYAFYKYFHVSGAEKGYWMTVDRYEGTAGDSLVHHNNSMFTTYDRDQDTNAEGNCGLKWSSGWWFRSCYWVNLNGIYQTGSIDQKDPGMKWFSFSGLDRSLSHTFMMIRKK